MREIVQCITGCGITPSDADLQQLWKALQIAPWIQEYAPDTGSANVYSAAINPVPTQLYVGMVVRVKISNTNTGPSTFNLNGLGAHSVRRATGAVVNAGDIQAGQIAALGFDGTNWQLINFLGFTSDTTVNNFTTQIPFAVDTGAVNALVGIFNPAITNLAAGNPFLMKVTNTNTGPVSIKCNSLAAVQLIWPDQSQLAAGEIVNGGLIFMVFDGTKMQLLTVIHPGGAAPTTFAGVPGTIDMWPTEVPPTGAYECNGQALSRVNDSRLYSIIGTMYGAPDPDHFNVPDLRGQFVRGWSHGSGVDPDAATRTNRGDGVAGDHVGTKQTDYYASHTHAFPSGGVTLDFGPERGTPPHPTGEYVVDPTLAPPNNSIVWGPVNGLVGKLPASPAGGWDISVTAGSQVVINKLSGLTITGTLASSGGGETRPKNVYLMFIMWR